MAILIIFLLGIGNFALQRAVMESDHPILARVPWHAHPLGGPVTLAVEFLLLLAALFYASQGNATGPIAYVVYSVLNSFSAWLILTDTV